jgi:hypothetical protein
MLKAFNARQLPFNTLCMCVFCGIYHNSISIADLFSYPSSAREELALRRNHALAPKPPCRWSCGPSKTDARQRRAIGRGGRRFAGACAGGGQLRRAGRTLFSWGLVAHDAGDRRFAAESEKIEAHWEQWSAIRITTRDGTLAGTAILMRVQGALEPRNERGCVSPLL